jgi:hypothetical protein
MTIKEKFEDIKIEAFSSDKTKATLRQVKVVTKNFTIRNAKAETFVSNLHSRLKREKPEALRSTKKASTPKATTRKKPTKAQCSTAGKKLKLDGDSRSGSILMECGADETFKAYFYKKSKGIVKNRKGFRPRKKK